MQTSYSITENNAKIDVLSNGILHITFNDGGILSTQLLREINIISRLKLGSCPQGIILSIHEGVDLEESFRIICRKAERFSPEIPVSIVCHSLGSLLIARHYQNKDKPIRPYRVFKSFNDSMQWISDIIKNRSKNTETRLNREQLLLPV